MRLVCPNCDAKYEVPDDAIPDGGRDVQCSACGHGWFQLPPDIEAAAEEYKKRGAGADPLGLYDLNVAKRLLADEGVTCP